MSLIDRINEITEHCEWAKNTIEDKVTFSLPKEQAEISRERRAHGALADACKLIKELKQTNTELQVKLDRAVDLLNSIDTVCADLLWKDSASIKQLYKGVRVTSNTIRTGLKELGVE